MLLASFASRSQSFEGTTSHTVLLAAANLWVIEKVWLAIPEVGRRAGGGLPHTGPRPRAILLARTPSVPKVFQNSIKLVLKGIFF